MIKLNFNSTVPPSSTMSRVIGEEYIIVATMTKISSLKYALYLLGRRSRTSFELKTKLSEKNYLEQEIEETIAKLEKAKLIDDERFAQNYAEDKVLIYRRGRHRIALELLQRGLTKDQIKKAFEAVNDEDELEAAKSLLKSKERQWTKLDPIARKRRATSLLQRRGFGVKIISELLWKKN